MNEQRRNFIDREKEQRTEFYLAEERRGLRKAEPCREGLFV
jgi:hypothetical protein